MLCSGYQSRSGIPHGGTLAPKHIHSSVSALSISNAATAGRSRLGSNCAENALFLQQDRRCPPRRLTVSLSSSKQPGPEEENCCNPGASFGGHHQFQRPAEASISGSNPPGVGPRTPGNYPSPSAAAAAGSGAAPAQGPVVVPCHSSNGQADGPAARTLVVTSEPINGPAISELPDQNSGADDETQGSLGASAISKAEPVEPLLPPPQRPAAISSPASDSSLRKSTQQATQDQGDHGSGTRHEQYHERLRLDDASPVDGGDPDPPLQPADRTHGSDNSAQQPVGQAPAQAPDQQQGAHQEHQRPQQPKTEGGPGALAAKEHQPGPSGSEQHGEQQQQQEQQQQHRLNGHDHSASGAAGPHPHQQGQLPPLRLDFLDATKWLQGWTPGTTDVGPNQGSQRRTSNRPAPRRRRGAAGSARSAAQNRDERIRQLVYAAITLIQLRAVVERHLPYMSAATAAVALSRLTALTAATQRLHRAQMRPPAATASAAAPAAGAGATLSKPPLPGSRSAGARKQTAASAVEAEVSMAGVSDGVANGRDGNQSDESDGVGSRALSAEQDGVTGDWEASGLQQRAQQQGPNGLRVGPDPAGSQAASSTAQGPASTATSSADFRSPSTSEPTDTDRQRPRGREASASGSSADIGSTSAMSVNGVGARSGSAPTLSVTTREQAGSIRLMRRLLMHIAFCMPGSPGATGSGSAARVGRGGSGGGAEGAGSVPLSAGVVAAASAPRHHSPPDHRARTAGTVLVTLARAGWRPTAEDARALYDILEAARPDLFLASPLQLARLATSLPALRLQPSTAWLDHFAAVSRSKMYCTGPGQLAAFAWCLAKLRYSPGELWLYSLTDHLLRNRKLSSASASHLCQLLWALHQMGFTPDADWRAACGRAVVAAAFGATDSAAARKSRGRGASDSPDERSSSDSDGYGEVDDADDDAVLGAGAGGEDGGNAPGHVASLLLWSVRTGTAPAPAALEACLERLQPHLRSLRRGQLLRLLLALSEGGHRPSEEFLGRTLACMQPKLPQLNATHQMQVLLAVSQLRFVPSQPWLRAFLQASRLQLRNYAPSHVTAIYQVFAGWQLRPPKPYLEDLHTYTDNLLGKFPPRSLAMMLHAMCSLGIKPQRRWLSRALDCLADGIAAGASADRGAAAAAAVGSSFPAAASAASAVDPGAAAGASGYPYDSLGGGSGGAGYLAEYGTASSLETSAGLTWEQRRQALRRQQRLTNAAALVTVVYSLRGVVQMDGERGRGPGGAGKLVLTAAAAPSPPPAESSSVSEGAAASAAVEPAAAQPQQVPLLPYELWGGMKRLMDLSRDFLLDVMTGAELLRLIKSLARVSFYPGRDFLAAHSQATVRVGAQLSPADKEEVAACYSRLAALAPLMAAEARRQVELRQARVSVLVADPWVE